MYKYALDNLNNRYPDINKVILLLLLLLIVLILIKEKINNAVMDITNTYAKKETNDNTSYQIIT